MQRNLIIVQALFDVSRKSASVGLNLKHAKYFCAFQSHTSCHDHADITGAKNDYIFTWHAVLLS